jgi:uncharacterized protein (TIGR02145 family)
MRKFRLQPFVKKQIGNTILVLLILVLTTCKKHNEPTGNIDFTKYKLGLVNTPSNVYLNISSAVLPPASSILPGDFKLEIPLNPFNQGQQGSCVSCATSMAKSVLDHLETHISYLNDGNIYSPAYLFNQVHWDPNNCIIGSTIYENLQVLKDQGVCKLSEMPYDDSNCNLSPSLLQKDQASSHKIDHFFRIDPISVSLIKQFIYAGHPVIVAFQVDDSFYRLSKSDIWHSFTSKSNGGHCTILYGWNDTTKAFKMLNSWGKQWGENGSTWVDYDFIENGTTSGGKVFTEAYVLQNPATNVNSPVAYFDINGQNSTINPGAQVKFRDLSSNNPTSWLWSFPGGTPSSSTLQNPTVTFKDPGSFSVSLKVTNQSGSNTKTSDDYINVNQTISTPVTQFSINGNQTIDPGSAVSFIDQSKNIPTSWYWSFPGGTPNSSTLQNPTVIYSTPGVYEVSLTASNSSGSSNLKKGSYITVKQGINWTPGEPFIDTRDGNTYATVVIGDQCWMAENLRFTNNHLVGLNYGNSSSNYITFGRLYSFNEVLNNSIAPAGWHIPTYNEIQIISDYLFTKYRDNYGGVMKSTNPLWAPPNSGANNISGFSALPGGMIFNNTSSDLAFNFYMWTSTAQGNNGGEAIFLSFNGTGIGGGFFSSPHYFSVRCIKNK